jgi:hypothetical protein
MTQFRQVPGHIKHPHGYVEIELVCMTEEQPIQKFQTLDYIEIKDFLHVTLGKPYKEATITPHLRKVVVQRLKTIYHLNLS